MIKWNFVNYKTFPRPAEVWFRRIVRLPKCLFHQYENFSPAIHHNIPIVWSWNSKLQIPPLWSLAAIVFPELCSKEHKKKKKNLPRSKLSRRCNSASNTRSLSPSLFVCLLVSTDLLKHSSDLYTRTSLHASDRERVYPEIDRDKIQCLPLRTAAWCLGASVEIWGAGGSHMLWRPSLPFWKKEGWVCVWVELERQGWNICMHVAQK